MNMTLLIILGVAALVVLWGVGIYNNLIRLLNLVKEGWSGIETQLKRRSDLIPNIVETVKGYAAHEKGTFEAITQARAAATAATDPAERAKAEGQVSALLGKIVAVAEAYPELKANTNFLELQRELSSVEEQINLARRYYNGAVRELNVLVESVPSNLLAKAFGFRCAAYFALDDARDGLSPQLEF